LLAGGADPNFVATSGPWLTTPPPLVIAVQKRQAPLVRLLLDAGADVRRSDGAGTNPLIAAAITGQRDLVELLLERGAPLDDMAREARFEAFHATALYHASANGHLEIVQLLLARGANINAMAYDDVEGPRGTPLMGASAGGHTAVVRALVKRGAALNETTYFGATALTLARRGEHAEIVRLLEQTGAKEFPNKLW
jgi:ankyrin repeat protein